MRTRRTLLHAAVALAGFSAVVPAARAQRTTTIGFGGGAAIPVGKFGDLYTAAPEGLVTIITGPPLSQLGLRLDYSYNSFRGQSAVGFAYSDTHMSSFTANLVYATRVGNLKPYAIGGYGWYPYRETGYTRRINGFGLNGGVGLAFPIPYSHIGAFLEVRYHDAHATGHLDRRFVPITLGITL